MSVENLVGIITNHNLYKEHSTNDVAKWFLRKTNVVWLSEQVEDFLSLNEIKGVNDSQDPWTKEERASFFITYRGYPNINEILDSFKKIYDERKNNFNVYARPKNLVENLKKIDQINNFLKAHPYSDPIFVKEINARAIEIGISGEDESVLDTIQLGLSRGINKSSLLTFINGDRKNYQNFIEKHHVVKEIDDNNSVGTFGYAGVSTLIISSMANDLFTKGLSETIDAVTGTIAYISPTLSKLSETLLTDSPIVSWVVTAGVIYKLMTGIERGINRNFIHTREGKVLGINPQEMNKDVFLRQITNGLMTPLVCRKEFDTTNTDNINNIALTAFVVEKLKNPALKIEDVQNSLGRSLNLKKEHIKNINKLGEDEIHEISLLHNPQIRDVFFKETISEQQKIALKNIDIAGKMLGFKAKDKGLPFEKINVGFSADFINKIENAYFNSPVNKVIVYSYLALCTDDDNKCDDKAIDFIMSSVKKRNLHTQEFLNELTEQVNDKFISLKNATPKHPFGFLKKTEGTVIFDTNNKVKEVFDDVADKCSMGYVKEFSATYKYGEINEKIINSKISNWKVQSMEDIKAKMKKLRDSVCIPKSPSGPTIP